MTMQHSRKSSCYCQINHPFPFVCVLCVYLLLIFAQDYEEEEVEMFDVSLTKNSQGLGITIAGYVGDKNSGEEWKKQLVYPQKNDLNVNNCSFFITQH